MGLFLTSFKQTCPESSVRFGWRIFVFSVTLLNFKISNNSVNYCAERVQAAGRVLFDEWYTMHLSSSWGQSVGYLYFYWDSFWVQNFNRNPIPRMSQHSSPHSVTMLFSMELFLPLCLHLTRKTQRPGCKHVGSLLEGGIARKRD